MYSIFLMRYVSLDGATATHEEIGESFSTPTIRYVCWTYVRTTLGGRYVYARSVLSFFSYFPNVRLSHTYNRRTTDALKFCFFTRALVVGQHSLLFRGARCANATHIFVGSVIAKRSRACLKNLTDDSASMYTP